MFQPNLKASIRNAYKVPVRFDPDLIATEGETFPPGSVAISLWPKPSEPLLPSTMISAAALEGNGGLSMKSQSKRRDPS
ncbi:hypothetical protein [Mesorhizobium sp.]|uniref:hypothetical protein n=1 Tax=Mesorhizobium sp. TaxID=1871066 RepID=UPI0012253F11|nr:hypothetical protein [Mesorhizobium sp.]TIL66823.1 MAG: hypothetical protein E5Y77_15725 [Mesorhizobium sp.]